MANQLSKTGIENSQTILASHVTQSVDALTGTQAYDITISGSLTLTGSVSSLNGFTGDLIGTASWASDAVSANTATTASYALTATSSSYTLSGSYSATAVSASYAATASSADTLIVRTALTASGLNYPATDGEADYFLSTDGAGNLSFDWVKTLHQNIRNVTTSSIVRGTPLYISGSTGDNANVYFADASNSNRRPATLIAYDATLAPGATGTGIISGEIQGVDTNLYPDGTIVYLAAGGGWTATRPTGSDTLVQALGIVTRQSNNGRGIVFNQIGNTLPNLLSGSIWVGDSDSVPISVLTSSLSVASAVNSTTTQNISSQYVPSGSLSFASSNLGMLAGSSTLSLGVSPIFNPTELSGKNFQTEFWVTATLASGSTTPTPMVNLYVESPGAGTFRIKEVGGTTSNDDFCFTVMYLKP